MILTSLYAVPAKAEDLAPFLSYCAGAIAAGDPAGSRLPQGVQANETGAILVEGKVAHFAMRRDGRGDWVCEVGDNSATELQRQVDTFLDDVNTVDRSRSTFGGNPYVAATICVGPNAVAMIMNGPLSADLGMGTAVFSGGMVSAGCGA